MVEQQDRPGGRSRAAEAFGGASENIPAASPLDWQRRIVRGKQCRRSLVIAAVLVTQAPGKPRRVPALNCGCPTACWCFSSTHAQLAELAGVGVKTVERALDELRRHGYLLRVKRGFRNGKIARGSVWRLITPTDTSDGSQKPATDTSDGSQKPATDTSDGSQKTVNRHFGVREPTPQTYYEQLVPSGQSSSSLVSYVQTARDDVATDDDDDPWRLDAQLADGRRA